MSAGSVSQFAGLGFIAFEGNGKANAEPVWNPFDVAVDAQAGKRGNALTSSIKALLKRQNADGGWGPTRELPSDAYATGQALYALSLAGVRHNRAELERGRAFLITNQRPDGSWLMIPRAHPGQTPFKNPAPIIYFGSSWATLGLLHSLPNESTRHPGE